MIYTCKTLDFMEIFCIFWTKKSLRFDHVSVYVCINKWVSVCVWAYVIFSHSRSFVGSIDRSMDKHSLSHSFTYLLYVMHIELNNFCCFIFNFNFFFFWFFVFVCLAVRFDLEKILLDVEQQQHLHRFSIMKKMMIIMTKDVAWWEL